MLEPAWRSSIGKDGKAGEKWKRRAALGDGYSSRFVLICMT